MGAADEPTVSTPLLSRSPEAGAQDDEPVTWSVGLVAALCALGLVSFGLVIGYSSPTAAQLSPALLSAPLLSFFEAAPTLTALCGGLAAGPFSDAAGRTRVLAAAASCYAAGWALIAAARGPPLLLTGRLFTGAGVGLSMATTPVYLAELAPPSKRGLLTSTNQLAINTGIALAYALGLPALHLGWRALAAAAVAPAAALLLASLLWMPESPRWLCARGRAAEAAAALRLLRAREDVAAELAGIEAAVAEAAALPPPSLADTCGRPALSRPLTVVLVLALFQQLTGINAIFYNASAIYAAAGFGKPDLVALLVQLPQIGVSVGACFLMDGWGRRPLLIGSSAAMAAGTALLGAALLAPASALSHAAAVTALVLTVSAFSGGMGPVPWMLLGELLPPRERATVAGVATIVNNIAAFLIIYTFRPLAATVGAGRVFFAYAAASAAAAAYTAAQLPETRGHSLEQIQADFEREADEAAAAGAREKRAGRRER